MHDARHPFEVCHRGEMRSIWRGLSLPRQEIRHLRMHDTMSLIIIFLARQEVVYFSPTYQRSTYLWLAERIACRSLVGELRGHAKANSVRQYCIS